MSNRSDVSAILADIDDTISRVRDLSTSPERAAALQCLADARRHLGLAIQARAIKAQVAASFGRAAGNAVELADVEQVIRTSPFRSVALDSVPPSATDNQRVRSEADEAFRESRRILREVLR
ncbi:MAG TPA: hypothetical protein VI653_00645 [Steroidobacteraceae bacterium]